MNGFLDKKSAMFTHKKSFKAIIASAVGIVFLVGVLVLFFSVQTKAYTNTDPFDLNGPEFAISGNYYLIDTVEQLQAVRNNNNDFDFKLNADLTLNMNAYGASQQTSKAVYGGEFDGQGHVIKIQNMNATGQSASAEVAEGVLFGKVTPHGAGNEGRVSNLIIELDAGSKYTYQTSNEVPAYDADIIDYHEILAVSDSSMNPSKVNQTKYYHQKDTVTTTPLNYTATASKDTYKCYKYTASTPEDQRYLDANVVSGTTISADNNLKSQFDSIITANNLGSIISNYSFIGSYPSTDEENHVTGTISNADTAVNAWKTVEPTSSSNTTTVTYGAYSENPVKQSLNNPTFTLSSNTYELVKTTTTRTKTGTATKTDTQPVYEKFALVNRTFTPEKTATRTYSSEGQVVNFGVICGTLDGNVSNVSIRGALSVNQNSNTTASLIKNTSGTCTIVDYYKVTGSNVYTHILPTDMSTNYAIPANDFDPALKTVWGSATETGAKVIAANMNVGAIAGTFSGSDVEGIEQLAAITSKMTASATLSDVITMNQGSLFGKTTAACAVNDCRIEKEAKGEASSNSTAMTTLNSGALIGSVGGATTLNDSLLFVDQSPTLSGNEIILSNAGSTITTNKCFTTKGTVTGTQAGDMQELTKVAFDQAGLGTDIKCLVVYKATPGEVKTDNTSLVKTEIYVNSWMCKMNSVFSHQFEKISGAETKKMSTTLAIPAGRTIKEISLNYRFMNTVSGEENNCLYLTTDPTEYKDLLVGSSSYVDITGSYAYDGYFYYYTNVPVSHTFEDTLAFDFGVNSALKRVITDEADYIEAYAKMDLTAIPVSGNTLSGNTLSGNTVSTNTVPTITTANFYYKNTTVSENGFTKISVQNSDIATLPGDSLTITAPIKFMTDNAEIYGFWEINGIYYRAETFAETFNASNRQPLLAAKGNTVEFYKELPGEALKSELVPLSAISENNCYQGQKIEIKEWDEVKNVGGKYSYFSYFSKDGSISLISSVLGKTENCFKNVKEFEIPQGIANNGENIYLYVVRQREMYPSTMVKYKIKLGENWDSITSSPDINSIIMANGVVTLNTATNTISTKADHGIELQGIRYCVSTTPLNTQKTLIAAKEGNNILKVGKFLTNSSSGVIDNMEIAIPPKLSTNTSTTFYVCAQLYGENFCGEVWRFRYSYPAKCESPKITPPTGSIISGLEPTASGQSVSLRTDQADTLIIYRLNSSIDSGTQVDGFDPATNALVVTEEDPLLEIRNQFPDDSKISYYQDTNTHVLYVKCNAKWYKIPNAAVYTDSLTLTNPLATKVQFSVNAVAFAMGYEVSKNATYAYEVVGKGRVEKPTGNTANAGTVTRYQNVFFKTVTGSADLYYTITYLLGNQDPLIATLVDPNKANLNTTLNPSGTTFAYDADNGIQIAGAEVTKYCVIKVYATKDNMDDSEIARYYYNIGDPDTVENPTSVPLDKSVVNPLQTILLITATKGATIYYSTTGTPTLNKDINGNYTPTDANTILYNPSTGIVMPQPVGLTDNFTIQAIAVKNGLKASAVKTFRYNYPPTVEMVYATPLSGSVTLNQEIKLSTSTADATIYYTVAYGGAEPEDPTISSTIYDGAQPIVITKDTKIKAIAIKNNVPSKIAEFSYTPTAKLGSPVASLASGAVVVRGTTITISSTDSSTIYYTTDGSSPTKVGNTAVMSGSSVMLDGEPGALVTIKAYAKMKDKSNSDEATFTYKVSKYTGGITADTPSGTELSAGSTINLITDVSDATIHYTIDGSNPSTSGKVGSTVKLDGEPGTTITVKAMATSPGGSTKAFALFSYKLSQKPTAPTASPSGGTLTVATNVVLTAAEGKIYYTIDGTEPSENSVLYSAPILVQKKTTLKAVAIKDNGEMSDIVTFQYEGAAKPEMVTSTVSGGSIEPGTKILLDTKTEGALIYYSTDGTNPSSSNYEKMLLYDEKGIEVNRSVVIKAVAVVEGMQLSNIAKFEYTVEKIPADEEKKKKEALLAEEQLHETDASKLVDKREDEKIEGTKYKDFVFEEQEYSTLISANKDILPSQVSLISKQVSASEQVQENVKSVFGERYTILSVFDMKLYQSTATIQPSGMVEIGIPIPKGSENAAIEIIYIDDNDKIERLETRRDGGMAYAETDHFSKYALVGMDTKKDMGFSFNIVYIVIGIMVYVLIFALAYGCITIFRVNKRRKKKLMRKDYPNE